MVAVVAVVVAHIDMLHSHWIIPPYDVYSTDRHTDRPSSSYDTSCGIRRSDDSSGALLKRDKANLKVRIVKLTPLVSLSLQFNLISFLWKNDFDNLLNHSKDISAESHTRSNSIIFIILSGIYAMCQVSWRDRCFSVFVFILAEGAKTASDHCISQIMTTVEFTLGISLQYSFASNNLICSKKNQLDKNFISIFFFGFFPNYERMEFFSWIGLESNLKAFDYSEKSVSLHM